MEELKLSSKGLVETWRGQFSREPFGKLRNLEIEECHNILVVIPSASKLQVWNNLEKFILRSCNSVKEVIQVDGGVVVGETDQTLLPKLTEMYLEDIPMLTHVFGFGFVSRPLILQNLHYLHVSECENLIKIMLPTFAKRLVQLKKLSVTNCYMVKEIVGDDDDASTEEEEEALTDIDDICFSTFNLEKPRPEHLLNLEKFSSASNNCAFPSLEEIEVKHLPSLTHLYKKIPGLDPDLQKLRFLGISCCLNLEIVLRLSMAKTLVHLKYLTVTDCDKVKKIVIKNDGGEPIDDEIIFSKSERLELEYLPNLKSFCSERYTFRFPCLTQVGDRMP